MQLATHNKGEIRRIFRMKIRQRRFERRVTIPTPDLRHSDSDDRDKADDQSITVLFSLGLLSNLILSKYPSSTA